MLPDNTFSCENFTVVSGCFESYFLAFRNAPLEHDIAGTLDLWKPFTNGIFAVRKSDQAYGRLYASPRKVNAPSSLLGYGCDDARGLDA